jgi:hypothetical protein
MTSTSHWIARSTRCAQAWRQPRWHVQMLPSPQSWVHSTLPGIVPAALAVTTVVVKAVSVAAVHLPSGHGA